MAKILIGDKYLREMRLTKEPSLIELAEVRELRANNARLYHWYIQLEVEHCIRMKHTACSGILFQAIILVVGFVIMATPHITIWGMLIMSPSVVLGTTFIIRGLRQYHTYQQRHSAALVRRRYG